MVAPRPQIPPELLAGMPVPGSTTPVPGSGGFIDAPSEGSLPPTMGSPLAPGRPEPVPQQPGGGDQVLQQLLQQFQQKPVVHTQQKERRAKVRKPKREEIEAAVQRDQLRYASTLHRFSRDVALFRQHDSSVPLSWKRDREDIVKSAEFSTLVNKLSNMFSKAGISYEVPYDTEDQRKSSQVIEDALYQLRKLSKRQYAMLGGNLQRDEFFYMFLYGRYVKRILPDLNDHRYPYADALLDPATCFPVFGGPKKGMIRMTRKYTQTVGDVITTYGEAMPDLEKKLAKKLGYDEYASSSDYFHETGEVVEYWDSWWRYVTFRGEEVMPITAHEIGEVPFVYIMPTGEPQSMSTPGGHYYHTDHEYGGVYAQMVSPDQDLAEKGVSIYHYLINQHRTKEKLMTILYNEVEKATDPSVVEYVAPHLAGEEHVPLDTKRGGHNRRQLNMQQLEGLPTSPRPTDFSPLFQTVQQEIVEGSLSPMIFGAEQGSNITGSGVDQMISQMKDLVLPYIQAWEYGQALEAELRLKMYVDTISPVITISAPEHDPRGDSQGELNDLSPIDIQNVGTFVEVEMTGLSLQNEAQLIAGLTQGVSAGFFSQRHAMERLDIKNPDKMFSEIITEKAMQHPEILENYVIPEGFIAQGMDEFADMWIQTVVMPKMMQMFSGMMGAQGQPQPGGGGAPGSQAVPNPMQGLEAQNPGGPPEGQGRGPAPQGSEGMI